MANILMYKVEEYNETHYTMFSGIYNDFKLKSFADYKFELEPLEYDEFINCIKQELMKCLVLFEDGIPTAFLAYTTVISESLELNIIHCVSDENANHKRRLLLEKFLELNKETTAQKVITYPMLGKQAEFIREISHYGFKFVGHSVVRFSLSNVSSLKILKSLTFPELEHHFSITDWHDSYFDKSVDIIHNAFKDTTDAFFDTRFKTHEGTVDIMQKITTGVYGEFLPCETKVLLYKDKPVGFCFANKTSSKIANIPLVAMDRRYRGRGFSKILLKNTVENIVNSAMNQGWELLEVNASVDTDNFQAVRMYRTVGFKEDYSYPQAYKPIASTK